VTPNRANRVGRIGARRREGAQAPFGNQTYQEAVLEWIYYSSENGEGSDIHPPRVIQGRADRRR